MYFGNVAEGNGGLGLLGAVGFAFRLWVGGFGGRLEFCKFTDLRVLNLIDFSLKVITKVFAF